MRHTGAQWRTDETQPQTSPMDAQDLCVRAWPGAGGANAAEISANMKTVERRMAVILVAGAIVTAMEPRRAGSDAGRQGFMRGPIG